MGASGLLNRNGFRVTGLLMVALLLVAASTGSASATLPGKNGKLLVSSYGDYGSPVSWQRWLFKSNLSGRTSRYLGKSNESFYDASISPDGHRVAYSRFPGDRLYLGLAANPLGAGAVTPEVAGLRSADAVFAPNGRSVYYSAELSGDESRNWRIKRYILKTGRVQTFTGKAKVDWGLSDVSPDGKHLLYNRGDDHDSKLMLLQVSTGKSRAIRVHRPANAGGFSPNGRLVAYTAEVGESWEVFTTRINGKGIRRITRNRQINLDPTFSPDGRSLAFVQGSGEKRRIGIANLGNLNIRYVKAPGRYTRIEQWLRK